MGVKRLADRSAPGNTEKNSLGGNLISYNMAA